MCLFDPVLAVLSSGSGRLSFRDLYADGGSGLGQVNRDVWYRVNTCSYDMVGEKGKGRGGCGLARSRLACGRTCGFSFWSASNPFQAI